MPAPSAKTSAPSALNEAQEELRALLTLAADNSQDEYRYTRHCMVKLLQGWERRTDPSIVAQALSTISSSLWCNMAAPACYWGFAMKIKYPNQVKAKINDFWDEDNSGPDDAPELTIARIRASINEPKILGQLVQNIENEGSAFTNLAKNQSLLPQVRQMFQEIINAPDPKVRQVFHAFPQVLRNKVSDLTDKKIEQETAVITAISKCNSLSQFMEKIIPMLEKFPAQDYTKGGALISEMQSYINSEEMPYKTFMQLEEQLTQYGWSPKQVFQLAPRLHLAELSAANEEYLSLWVYHNPKKLMDHIDDFLSARFELTTASLAKTNKVLSVLQKYGVGQKELDQYYQKNPAPFELSDFFTNVVCSKNFASKWIAALESPAFETYKKSAPQKMVGTALLFGKLAGAQISGSIPAPFELPVHSRCDFDHFEDWVGEKRAHVALDLQNKYIALSQGAVIKNQIKSDAGSVRVSKRRL